MVAFTAWVAFAVALVLLCVDDAVAIINLALDLVVGALTIWGLMWAAREFGEASIKPAIRILAGDPNSPPIAGTPGALVYRLLETPPFQMTGWSKLRCVGSTPIDTPCLACGLYLHNETSRAGRRIYMVVQVRVDPMPQSCQFWHGPFPVGSRRIPGRLGAETGCYTLAVQFAEELVVYESPVFVGELILTWDERLDDDVLPESIALTYDIYTLDGASRGQTDLLITEWRWRDWPAGREGQ
jgi:hypothetical protein